MNDVLCAGALHIFKKGFSFAVDGPGNRLVYHLRGCNFRCPWCANPECFLPMEGNGTPVGALLKEAGQAKPLYFAGGGVTFTGGEPTCQFEALREALQGLKALGIHTCVESNGTHPGLPALFPLIDLLILDCKHYDSAAHKKWTGQGNEQVLANIKILSKNDNYLSNNDNTKNKILSNNDKKLLVRIPLIGGVNASQEDAAAFAALLRKLGNFPIETLRYHEFGKPKWARLGMEYTMRGAEVSEDQARRFEEILSDRQLKA